MPSQIRGVQGVETEVLVPGGPICKLIHGLRRYNLHIIGAGGLRYFK